MDLIKLKEEHQRLKKILVDNYNEHYHKELLIDFYDGGLENHISELDELIYLEPFSEELTRILIQSENLNDSESFEIKLELIGIKKDVDIKITGNKIYKEEVELSTNPESTYIPLSPDIDLLLINKLEELLIENKFIIENKSSSLVSVFNGKWNKQKIQWNDVEYLFTAFINILEDNNITSSNVIRNKYKLFINFFLNRKGNDYVSKQVSKSAYNLSSKHSIKREELLKNIINQAFN